MHTVHLSSALSITVIGLVLSGCGRSGNEAAQMSTAVQEEIRHSNRLAGETSPYLLQHAGNPVNWFAWSDDAFEKAKAENKPVFLSIGYSACHWCHVMEEESFEDEATAEILNKYFISIKVDREEHPDVDNVYMASVQLLTGSGGWPLSVFLTPDRRPFYGGTYFPPEDMYGRPGFKTVLNKIAAVWDEEPEGILESAETITKAMQAQVDQSSDAAAGDPKQVLDAVVSQLSSQFDSRWGGFSGAPKFPQVGLVEILLRSYSRTGDAEQLAMARKTLDSMAEGGLYDQLGGGFHRYSVDGHWLVPHFEKMLYDNAQLARVYLDAWQLTRDENYKRIATETLDYILRDMTAPGGAFYASEDADSEGEEGKFYVWSYDGIMSVLGADGEGFAHYYGVTGEGNFEGHNILNLIKPGPKPDGLDELRAKLLAARGKRIRPTRDEKIIASWNGMMITAFARAAIALNSERYAEAAIRAAKALLKNMIEDGRIDHTYREKGEQIPGYLTDYAAVANAFIDVYEVTHDPVWIERAGALAERMAEEFNDPEDAAFFFVTDDHSQLPARAKLFIESSVPSGNSMAALLLLRLGRITDDSEYRERADKIARIALVYLEKFSQSMPSMLNTLDELVYPGPEIVIIGETGSEDTNAMLDAFRKRYLPGRILMVGAPGRLAEKWPLLTGRDKIGGKAALYVCRDNVCTKPMTDPAELVTLPSQSEYKLNAMLQQEVDDDYREDDRTAE